MNNLFHLPAIAISDQSVGKEVLINSVIESCFSKATQETVELKLKIVINNSHVLALKLHHQQQLWRHS